MERVGERFSKLCLYACVSRSRTRVLVPRFRVGIPVVTQWLDGDVAKVLPSALVNI
jgi:hypothetical protein